MWPCARCKSAAAMAQSWRATLVIAAGERDQRAALDHQHLTIGDGFGREGVLVADFETEDVARQIERLRSGGGRR